MTCESAVFGISGTRLTDEEARFLETANPFGIILFARNIVDASTLCALTAELRETVGVSHLPILIDQEGGRVARLTPPMVTAFPSAAAYGRFYRTAPAVAGAMLHRHAQLLGRELASYGINVNCAPCLDVLTPVTHTMIGDRAYGDDPLLVSACGGFLAAGLISGGVLPVIKHLPGHGRAAQDSHRTCPEVSSAHSILSASDFVPFVKLADMLMGMSAHIRFTALDATVATQSPQIISEIIRGEIGFDGLLLSDDINMGALEGDVVARARLALTAGCDIVLHCSGNIDEMRALADAAFSMTAVSRGRCVRVSDALTQLAAVSSSCSLPDFEEAQATVLSELQADIFLGG